MNKNPTAWTIRLLFLKILSSSLKSGQELWWMYVIVPFILTILFTENLSFEVAHLAKDIIAVNKWHLRLSLGLWLQSLDF